MAVLAVLAVLIQCFRMLDSERPPKNGRSAGGLQAMIAGSCWIAGAVEEFRRCKIILVFF